MSTEEPAKEGIKNGTASLASLLNQLNLPTLAAVLLMGGGNFFATKEDGRLTREEAQHVIRQVNDLHDALDLFEKRQKDMLQKGTETLDNQNQLLKNQSMMISNQQQFLNKIQRTPP